MKFLASTIPSVVLEEPQPGTIWPDEFPLRAREFVVEIHNRAELPIAFLGLRFDMQNRDGTLAAVMSYSDSLRYPDRATFLPGHSRLICIEHGLTGCLARRIPFHDVPGQNRILMNIDNVGKRRRVIASLDCVAFSDGRFLGPDTGAAFDRLAAEREREMIAPPDGSHRPLRIPLIRI